MFYLTDGIFETGVYAVPSKSRNSTVLGQGGSSSIQCSNPSWTYHWQHSFVCDVTMWCQLAPFGTTLPHLEQMDLLKKVINTNLQFFDYKSFVLNKIFYILTF